MKTLNGQDTGTVMWWSDRDKNGIILDSNKNEYYFDSSTWKNKLEPIRGQAVKFTSNRLNGFLVAKNVTDLLG